MLSSCVFCLQSSPKRQNALSLSSASSVQTTKRMLAPLLALLALAGPASAWDSDRPLERRSTTSEPHGSIKWFDCPDAPKHDFDCGYLSVPMSYNPKDKLFKKTVSLALRRQRAKGKKWASAPHLFINPGGPGASGTG